MNNNQLLPTIVTLVVASWNPIALALSPAEVDAVAWQVSVLISPNLTQQGDAFLIEGEKTGSGVIVAQEGNSYYVLTALHVVWKRGGFHAIAMPDGQVYYVDASENSPDILPLGHPSGELGQTIAGLDLALLRVPSDRPYPVARIAPNPVQSGTPVFVSGWPNPDDLRQTIRDRQLVEGAIAEVTPASEDGGYRLLYSNPTRSGMSGGGIFNANGELIGIHGRGRGVQNNCSTPEVNANNSCGMYIGEFLADSRVESLRLSWNRNPVDLGMIQYGLTYTSQTDRVNGSPVARSTPPPVIPPTITPETPQASPSPAPVADFPTPSPEAIAEAHTIYYVDPNQGNNAATAGLTPENPFRSISYALQGARPGTVIYLAPGLYSARETFPLKLNPGVILIGNESQQGEGVFIRGGGIASTRSAGRQNYTLFAGNNSQILGITLTNPHSDGTGIWIEDTTTALIRNNTLRDNPREGILIGGTATPILEKNRFVNNGGNGISVIQQGGGEIRSNDFTNNGMGVAIAGMGNPLIADNHIRSNRNGIVVTASAMPTIQGNILENNQNYGILTLGLAKPTLAENNLFRTNGVSNQLTAKIQEWESESPRGTVTSTIFGCLEYEGGLATFAYQGRGSIPLPFLNWTDSPSESGLNRCRLVTSSLNKIITLNGQDLSTMALSTGRIHNNNGVCLVEESGEICQDSNLLFYLGGEEQRNPGEGLAPLLHFSWATAGNPVQQVETGAFAPLKDFAQRLEPEPGLWFTD
ncbi:DUF1565 domain-containing protein [Laspinema olomoucense]|uniref:DUF1565 domain-containing protein n=1 Tax=Laspinema olomoucense TaxID=3231600 RepID=UPI0021BBA8CA|nr:DUF1565 domain-containing protein [Laspinema sp. D3c]MCT7995096.1 DUF1565 domain-containing protein [Laspinema sp. D3c]